MQLKQCNVGNNNGKCKCINSFVRHTHKSHILYSDIQCNSQINNNRNTWKYSVTVSVSVSSQQPDLKRPSRKVSAICLSSLYDCLSLTFSFSF